MLFVHLFGWAAIGVLAGPLGPSREAPGDQLVPPPDSDDGHYSPHRPGGNLPRAPSLSNTVIDIAASTPPPMATTVKPHDPECTTTVFVNLLRSGLHGHTRTVHATTVVTTVHYDCHGCKNLIMDNIGGLGPVVRYSTMTTDSATPAVETEYACLKSSSAALATDVPPTTQSPSPPPALPTPKN